LPWVAAPLVLLALNLAIAVPTTPGHVGAFEAAVVVALELLGCARPAALAFALVYHALMVLPVTAVGIVVFWRLRRAAEPGLAAASSTELVVVGSLDTSDGEGL